MQVQWWSSSVQSLVRKQPLMAELSAALSRQECAGGRSQQGLCPVFYNLTVEEFSRCNFREQLDEYTETVQELSEFVGLGQPQVCLNLQTRCNPFIHSTTWRLSACPALAPCLHSSHAWRLCCGSTPLQGTCSVPPAVYSNAMHVH